MWTPSMVGKPRFLVSSRRKPIVSSTKWHGRTGWTPGLHPPRCSARAAERRAAGRDRGQRNDAGDRRRRLGRGAAGLGCRPWGCRRRAAHHRPSSAATSAELLPGEVDSVGWLAVLSASKFPPIEMATLPAIARTLAMILSKCLAPRS
jgi:hypothetical protein